MAIISNPIDYFASRFQVCGLNECWPWKRGCDDKGYGMFKTKSIPGERRAHRIMWHFENGNITDGIHVLHKCDNPPCVNPNHLFLGTHQDNIKDREQKRRGGSYKGKHWWLRKFSDEEVEAICKMRDEGFTFASIAKQFGCSAATVLHICRGDYVE